MYPGRPAFECLDLLSGTAFSEGTTPVDIETGTGILDRASGGIDARLPVTELDIRTAGITRRTIGIFPAVAYGYQQSPRRPVNPVKQFPDLLHLGRCRLDHQVIAHPCNCSIRADQRPDDR